MIELEEPAVSTDKAAPELVVQADELIDQLYSLDLTNVREAQAKALSVQRLGTRVQENIARKRRRGRRPGCAKPAGTPAPGQRNQPERR